VLALLGPQGGAEVSPSDATRPSLIRYLPGMSVLDLVFASTVTATIVALIIAALKSFAYTLPAKAWRWAVSRCTLSITLTSSEAGFGMLRDWLADHPYAKKARAVKMTYSAGAGKFVLAPGHGSHLLWFDGPLWVKYGRTNTKNEGISLQEEQYTVTMFALHHSKMERFMEELSAYQKKEVSSLVVYTWRGGYWHWFGSKRKRSLDTVYMPASTKDAVIKAIKDFLAAEEWYAARGIPWRMGLMFEGGPGTGKTTLATALAGYFDKSLYSMNLASVGSDETLLHAFSSAQKNGIILIEDVDGFEAAQDRGNIEIETSPAGSEQLPQEMPLEFPEWPTSDADQASFISSFLSAPPVTAKRGTTKTQSPNQVTISGLLNAIDGVAATEGRILIMTTNDISKLDPALLRSGRIDHKFTIGHLTPADVLDMFRCFFPGEERYHARVQAYAGHRSTTAAAWQKLFVKYHDDVDKLIGEGLV
jgi:chaperone BCS1